MPRAVPRRPYDGYRHGNAEGKGTERSHVSVPSRNCLADLHIPPTPQEQVSWKGSLADPNVAAGYRDPQLIEQAAPLLAVLVVARSETNSTSIGFASRASVVFS
jgi:hypothetical protein